MKDRPWPLLIATAAYSYLFYNQSPGVNYLLFTIVLVILILNKTKEEVRQHRSWQITALACVLTAVNIVVINSSLAILANVISLMLLAVFSRAPSTSVFMAAFHAVYSLVGSAVLSIIEKVNTKGDGQNASRSYSTIGKRKLSMVGVPVLIFTIFLVLYSNSSIGFEHALSFISFDFISWPWVWFTFFGGWMLVGFFKPLVIKEWATLDAEAPNILSRVKGRGKKDFNPQGLTYEYKTGVLLLVILNGLLFAFLVSDAYFLFVGDLPTGVKYSDFLHQGVYTLIVTILLAIGILLYLFRNNLNFYGRNQTLKRLAYLWLGMNMLLVVLTLTKNSIYITGTGLTYKRIGVYTYLLLTGIGLIVSYIKISKVKTSWYLFRKNAWAVYLILILFSTINWDRLLTYYNLSYANSPDLDYLFTLSNSNLPLLAEQIKTPKHRFTDAHRLQVEFFRSEHLRKEQLKQWQSWNYIDWRVAEDLK